jgi:hypothetical protein
MSDIRTQLLVSAADRMVKTVDSFSELLQEFEISEELITAIGNMAVRTSRYQRTIVLACAANVCATEWTENDLQRQLDELRVQVRDAWRAWVLEGTVADEQAWYQAKYDAWPKCVDCSRSLVDEDAHGVCGHCATEKREEELFQEQLFVK